MLIVVALALAIGEFIDAFFIDFPVAAVVVGVLFVAVAFWIRRGGRGGVILVGVLAALEVVGVPFYERNDAGDWIEQMAFLAGSLIGLAAAFAILRGGSSES